MPPRGDTGRGKATKPEEAIVNEEVNTEKVSTDLSDEEMELIIAGLYAVSNVLPGAEALIEKLGFGS